MQTRIYGKKYVNGSVNTEGHLKNIFKKTENYPLCHQKPEPARKTVPLKVRLMKTEDGRKRYQSDRRE